MQKQKIGRLDDNDLFLRDTDYNRVQNGRYYKLQLADGRELGSRPLIESSETSSLITVGPANSGDLFRIHDSEWPSNEARILFMQDQWNPASNLDKAVARSSDGRLGWSSSQYDGVQIFGVRNNGHNFIRLMYESSSGKNDRRLWVAELDGDSGRNIVRTSHGGALTFEVYFMYACDVDF
ncbi:predicted protein [Uncinocarpus reesii 1704]|uniref:Uncharacterized protein n=1 Tax=Uncinocarpus reesii (strain UAMH 1704) TaxID=336963 RepID=C4JMX5_UNCRE|nr:uncharacterized protein UREG_04183 [Uncinocarpus reesii 1704]EEP79337.1 predicted protein [Uncinocarpus reesii 1704]